MTSLHLLLRTIVLAAVLAVAAVSPAAAAPTAMPATATGPPAGVPGPPGSTTGLPAGPSKPVRVNGAPAKTAIFPWAVAADAGKLDVVYYGTSYHDAGGTAAPGCTAEFANTPRCDHTEVATQTGGRGIFGGRSR